MEKHYVETVRLLLETAPEVFAVPLFALKGGTALNLFVHDMPRLSVDIDVVYINHRSNRTEALGEITAGLTRVREGLAAQGLAAEIIGGQQGEETKLMVRRSRVMVKVEVNHVFRGTLLPVETRRLNKGARDLNPAVRYQKSR